jgi:hypothetical protein
LWIELLKSAFYKGDGELETLPNIDINIKSGNSLISRFALDADIRPALRKHSIKIKQYRASVLKYQNARSKAEKADMQAFIDKLKGNLRTEIFDNDPKVRQLRTLQAELATLQNQTLLFGETSAMKRARVARERQLKADIKRLEASIDEIKGNTMFRDAFEWRFEFPEVLDEDGVFVGFDAVIGNPPYGVRTPELTREYVGLTVGRVPDYEIYYWFLNRARQILRPKGILSYIIPNSFLFNVGARNYRLEFVSRWDVIDVLDCTDFPLFPDAVVRNVILSARKVENAAGIFYRPTEGAKSFGDLASRPTRFVSTAVLAENNTNWGLLFKLDQAVLDLVARLRQYPKVESAFEATQGFIPYRLKDLTARLGAVEAKSIVKDRKWHSNRQEGPDYVEEIFGRSLSRYGYSRSGKFVKYGPHVATYVEPRFFNQSRLLVREITSPTIIATLVEEMFVNDPQIIAVIARQDSVYPLRLLWAILNSKLAVFYHFNGSPKATKGLFPKVLVGDVKQFPLPRTIDQVKFQRLETLVGQAFQQAPSGAALDTVETAIDDAVMDLYDLSNSEIELVRAFQLPSRTADGETDSVVA